MRFEATAGRLVISAQDGAALDFDLNAFVAQLSERGSSRAVEDLSLEAREEPLRVRLVFQDLSGILDESRINIHAGNIMVLIDRTDR